MTRLFNDKVHKQHSNTSHFDLSAPQAQHVSLAGNFNDWDPDKGTMHKGPDGVWHLNLVLKPGRYEYRFIVDGLWSDDPAAQQKAANSLGTENCVRIV